MLVRDQLNRELSFSKPPERIVSLVPSQTELLIYLGLRDKLVGVTKFCVHPSDLRKSTVLVGGTKNVNFEKIAALNPDIIICNKEENTKEIVQSLHEVTPVWVSDISNMAESLDMIKKLGEIFETSEKAVELIKKIEEERKAFQKEIKNIKLKKVTYLIWKNPYMAVGRQTFVDEMLRLNHFENIVEKSRYPEVNLEELHKADLVFLSSEPYPFKESDAQELQSLLNKEVKIVDGEYFSWYGSRLKDAFQYFRTLHS